MIDVEKLIAKMPFDEACDMAIDASGGPDAFRPYLPFGADLDVLAVKYAQDRNFNQGDMAAPYLTVWDRAAGFQVDERPIQPPAYRYAGGGPHRLLQSNGVKPLTLSLTVVLLKRAAYRLLLDAGLAPPPPDKAIVIQPYPGILTEAGTCRTCAGGWTCSAAWTRARFTCSCRWQSDFQAACPPARLVSCRSCCPTRRGPASCPSSMNDCAWTTTYDPGSTE